MQAGRPQPRKAKGWIGIENATIAITVEGIDRADSNVRRVGLPAFRPCDSSLTREANPLRRTRRGKGECWFSGGLWAQRTAPATTEEIWTVRGAQAIVRCVHGARGRLLS